MTPYTLPQLPYAKDALAPYLSAETFDYHYGKHHQSYVDKINKLLLGTEYEKLDLLEVVQKSKGPLFNSAAQHWNHSFYWKSMSAEKNQTPKGALSEAILKDFGSLAELESQFKSAASSQFGSGWAWLTKDLAGKLKIEATSNAETPVRDGALKPLFTCDVWEHAYYIDYRNARAKYIEAFWKVLSWRFAEENFSNSVV